MKYPLAIALATASISAFSATDKREYYLCTPYVGDEEQDYMIIAGETKDHYSFVQIGAVTHRTIRTKKGKYESRFDWWDENDVTQSIYVERDDRYSNKTAYVADLYDFSTTDEEGLSHVEQTWQCLKR